MRNLNHVAAFVAVVDAGGYNAAARRLGLTAQALQKAVQNTEAELGLPLFARAAKRLALTDGGRAYLEGCRRVLSAVEEARHLVAGHRYGGNAVLRVSMPPALGRLHLLPALRGFLDRHRDTRIAALIVDRSEDTALEGVDVVFDDGDHARPGMAFRPLAVPVFRICASAAYLARRGTPRDLADIEASGHECVGLLSPATDRLFPWRLRTAEGGLELREMRGRLAVTDSDAGLAAAVAGLGLVQLPDHVAGQALKAGDLVEVLPERSHGGPPISIGYHTDRRLHREVQAFIDHFVDWFASWTNSPGRVA